MKNFAEDQENPWSGRISENQLYLHEKVRPVPWDEMDFQEMEGAIALLGYSCDEGVQRNQGRPGARKGPYAIRKALGKLPNHLSQNAKFLDVGDVICKGNALEEAQSNLAEKVTRLLGSGAFPILLGGGHDIAYGHYTGIRSHLGNSVRLGIINFDAHLDLRPPVNGPNSGTPFFQIAQDCRTQGFIFQYMCLGVREDANNAQLFKTAQELGVTIINRSDFHMSNWSTVKGHLIEYLNSVDAIYTTIDLDGFSSAFAPGVSAASPMGYAPDIVLQSLDLIITSNKLVGLDLAEMNPAHDIDNQTAKLAASLVHFVIHQWSK
ncbi:MAG: formimidoylglutamase [Flavobacteriaceae bacterium]